MAETNDIPEANMQQDGESSPLSSPALFMRSSPPDEEGNGLLRAVDTPMESSPAPTGVTVGSKKRKYASNGYANGEDEDEDEEAEAPRPKKKGKGRKSGGTGRSKKGIGSRVIPRTFEECEDIDKKLITLRDGGMSWPEIRKMWKEETGEEAGKSTLPNRYMRLKVNFTVINNDDNARLLKCHREVDEAFEKERWSLVSKAMSREGSQVYLPEVLARQFKKLLHQGANLRAGRDVNEGVPEE